jgi:GrpB-like predicted nucleotidyltransferase (UPF0157 family)
VPGLAAKPIIDILLVVADSSDEPSCLPALESVGYRLHIHEPDWHQYRLLTDTEPDVSVPVFSTGAVAPRSTEGREVRRLVDVGPRSGKHRREVVTDSRSRSRGDVILSDPRPRTIDPALLGNLHRHLHR